ncbi:MAG TPA: long-chain-fatty-acid--CoA ligase [Rhodoglobus sp.]|nr:long-chain-fatty-acid--CoA ligase [Rhodoglobus sp.]
MTSYADRPWLTSYAPGVPADITDVRETLVDMLAGSVRRHRRRVALEFFGAETTYGELGEQVERVAGSLRKLGVRRGDRVALVLPNCPQHVVAFYAVLRLGAVVVEHNPLYTERELRHQFEDHGAVAAIVWDKVAQTVLDFPADVRPASVVAVDVTRAMPLRTRFALRLPIARARTSRSALTVGGPVKGALEWRDVVRSPRIQRRHPRPALDDIAVLQYTSGTTGMPKGAILTHRNLRANAMQGEAWLPGLRTGREVVYAVLPMFHAYGLTLCLTFAMSVGARLVLFPKFEPGLVLDAMRRSPATFLPAVPPIYERLAKAAGEARVSLRSIRFAISGAMNLPVETVRTWEETTGGLLVEGYGMTETSPVAVGNPVGPTRRPGAVGVPFPSTEVRVVDPDDPAVDRAFGEEGELLVRGPQVFQGYWNRPDETRASLLPGGWLRTGDIVRIDDDGFVTIVDRMKELIITGGFNVAPTEVEAALLVEPSIRDVAVVGLPSRHGGEDVVAAVVLEDGATLDVERIRAGARSRLTAYKVPKRVVQVDELPRSLIGKVLRREVRDRLGGR